MAIPRYVFAELAEAIMLIGVKKATKYLSPTEVVKATRRGKPGKRAKQTEILFTVGSPNYAERLFIKDCVKASVSFPVKKVQLKFDAKKKKAA